MTLLFDFTGRSVVVTGGAAGIGAAVVFGERREAGSQEVGVALGEARGGNHPAPAEIGQHQLRCGEVKAVPEGVPPALATHGCVLECLDARTADFLIPSQRTSQRAVIRVLLADDQALVRAGFRVLAGSAPDIDVVGEAADGAAAVDLARSLRAEVVLMDIRMPGTDGLEATRQIAADPELSGVRVIILTTFEADEYVFEAIRAGASGFLVKDTEPEDLVSAIRVVARGDALLSPSGPPR